MPGSSSHTISVVISTFERPDACERALISVLGQTDKPLEVLVCDNGSSDGTPDRFRDWEHRREDVRYLRLPTNTGTPAPARNLGIAHARGDWIAFLDDDDEWLPQKLARQRQAATEQCADVIATNALRKSTEAAYFADAPATLKPTRAELLAANPIITSSAMVRRHLAGFPTAVWMRGIEDYAAWLSLVDGGASFLVLGEPLVRYEDGSSDRLSTARARGELAIARFALSRAIRRPSDREYVKAACRRAVGAAYVAAVDGLAAIRAHAGTPD